jgi:LysR family transcriptional regulator, transcriptional activator for bauABCD operon
MMPPNQIEIDVLDGKLHVGAVPELRPLPGLNYYPLYQEESLLYCSKDHPYFNIDDKNITSKMIAQCEAVVLSYQQTPEIKRKLQKLNSTASATDREGIAFLILTGRYIGYLPTHFAKQWVADGEVRALIPQKLRILTQYSAITRKSARANIILDTFLQQLDFTS